MKRFSLLTATSKRAANHCLALILLFTAQSVWADADYEREQRWADEVTPSVVVGEVQYLEARNHRFLALYTQAPNAKASLVIVHGSGFHPDHSLIGELRSRLAELGYTTLSIQMPVLGPDATGRDYWPLLPEAEDRIKAAIEYLRDKGAKKVAIVSHSLGSYQTYNFLKDNPDASVAAWVAIGMTGDTFSGLSLPIYDLCGENDLPLVLRSVSKRAETLKNVKSAQSIVPSMDHYFNYFSRQNGDLVNYVKAYLDKTL